MAVDFRQEAEEEHARWPVRPIYGAAAPHTQSPAAQSQTTQPPSQAEPTVRHAEGGLFLPPGVRVEARVLGPVEVVG